MRLRPGNAQHQGSRDAQQDAFGFSDLDDRAFVAHGGFLGAVADGMGGLAHGGAASAAAIRTLLASYAAKRRDESVGDALERAAREANSAVVELARSSGHETEIGTTLAAVVVHDGCLSWVGVGDSRVYVWRDGRLAQVTLDHNYAAELDAKAAAGDIDPDVAAADPDREALTSYLGRPTLAAVDRSARALPLLSGDRVLLCSDGLYRALSLAEIAGALDGNPQDACESLVDAALARRLPRQDNLTVLVVALDDDQVRSRVAESSR
ncbi:MAG: PP2C family serine/threonine-protein phosphatase [Vicinamibacterales bacterium]